MQRSRSSRVQLVDLFFRVGSPSCAEASSQLRQTRHLVIRSQIRCAATCWKVTGRPCNLRSMYRTFGPHTIVLTKAWRYPSGFYPRFTRRLAPRRSRQLRARLHRPPTSSAELLVSRPVRSLSPLVSEQIKRGPHGTHSNGRSPAMGSGGGWAAHKGAAQLDKEVSGAAYCSRSRYRRGDRGRGGGPDARGRGTQPLGLHLA